MSESVTDGGHQRWFRTMVLMGGSLALACGGISVDARDEHDAAGAGGNAGVGTGGASGGGMGAQGGSSSTTGGSGGVCSPSQWTCASVPTCDRADGYALPADCTCDGARPLAGSDCPSGRRVCLTARFAADGTLLSEPIPFECACAPDPASCSNSCHLAFPDGDGHSCQEVTPQRLPLPPPPAVDDDMLCGCSFVFLR